MANQISKDELVAAAIEKIAAGSANAMDDLYKNIGADVYAFALANTNTKSDAENLLQETFVLVYKYAKRFVDNGKALDWVLNIANNLANKKYGEEQSLFKSKLSMGKYKKRAALELPEILDSIKATCSSISQDDKTYDFVPPMTKEFKRNLIIGCVVILLAVLLIGCKIGGRNKLSKDIVASVYVDADESIELEINKDMLVYSVTGLDDESAEFVEGLSLEGEDTTTAVESLIGYMYMDGCFETAEDEAAAAVLVSVDADEDEDFEAVYEDLSDAFSDTPFDYTIILQRIDAEKMQEKADKYEVSVSKMSLVASIISSSDDYTKDDTETLCDDSIAELAVIYNGLGTVEEASDEEAEDEASEDSEDSDSKDSSDSSDDSASTSVSDVMVFIKDKTSDVVEGAQDAASDAVENAVDSAKDAAEDAATDAVENAVDSAIEDHKDEIPDDVDTDSIKEQIIDFIKGLFN